MVFNIVCIMKRPTLRYGNEKTGTKAGRAEFIGILEAHLKDRGFCSDMQPLLRNGVNYNPQTAGRHVKASLLNLLPE